MVRIDQRVSVGSSIARARCRRPGRASARWPCRRPCRAGSPACRAGSPAAASRARRAPRSARRSRGGSRRSRRRGRTAARRARARSAAARARPVDVVRVDVDDVVVADDRGSRRGAARRSAPTVARLAERVDEVLARSLELGAAVREPDHPVGAAALAGQQRGAAARAVGAAQKAWRNSSPWSASRWMFGVGT